MAKAHKTHPKPKSKKSIKKTNKLIQSNYEKLKKLKEQM